MYVDFWVWKYILDIIFISQNILDSKVALLLRCQNHFYEYLFKQSKSIYLGRSIRNKWQVFDWKKNDFRDKLRFLQMAYVPGSVKYIYNSFSFETFPSLLLSKGSKVVGRACMGERMRLYSGFNKRGALICLPPSLYSNCLKNWCTFLKF